MFFVRATEFCHKEKLQQQDFWNIVYMNTSGMSHLTACGYYSLSCQIRFYEQGNFWSSC